MTLQWRHNGRDSVSNHQPHDCLLNRLFRRRSKKTSKLRVTGFCAGNSPGTDESPAQMASCAENVSIWWRHHGVLRDAYITNIRELRDYNKNNPRFMKWYHSMFRDFLTALAHIGTGCQPMWACAVIQWYTLRIHGSAASRRTNATHAFRRRFLKCALLVLKRNFACKLLTN